MIRRMNIREIIEATRLGFPALAELSGLSADTVRSLHAARRTGRPETRAQLAAAIRAHGHRLVELADLINPPPPEDSGEQADVSV